MSDIEVRRFAFSDEDFRNHAIRIRTEVFVKEQGVPAELEYDGEDALANQYLLLADSLPVATARWRLTAKGIKLERFAMLKEYRNRGLGRFLLDAVMDDVLPLNTRIYLHAQESAVSFYRRRGFETDGEAFMEAGIRHFRMVWPQFNG